MAHQWVIHPQDQIAEVRLTDNIGPSDIVEAGASLPHQEGWESHFNILYNCVHDASLSDVTLNALEELLPKMLKRGAELRKGRGENIPRSAILYSNPILQSILELWVMTNKNNTLVEFKLFTSRTKADKWLKNETTE